jgi:hypothetical protein
MNRKCLILIGVVLGGMLGCPGWLSSQNIIFTIPNVNGTRGTTVDVPVQVQGIGVADSVVSYQLTISFNSSIIQAVGANRQGTMTEFWGAPYVAPKTDTVRVGGFTTNRPDKRLVADAGILIKLRFLVVGSTGSSSDIRITDKKLYNLQGEMNVNSINNGTLTVLNNQNTTNIDITLYPGWNLISFRLVAQPSALPDILDGLPVDYIFGFYSGEGPRTWDVNRPPFLNDLQMLDGLHGYWVKMSSEQAEILTISGNVISATTPIPLYYDWNLIGYLPSSSNALTTSFQSINPLYSYVMGYNGSTGLPQTWDRDRPEWLNDLTTLTPKSGYWLKMDSSRTLIYPAGEAMPKERPNPAPMTSYEEKSTSTRQPPQFCDFWAVQPDMFRMGNKVQVYDGDGVLCGDTMATAQGGFLVHVSGDDISTPGIDEGAEPGEAVLFMVNGDTAEVIGTSANFDTTIVVGGAPTWENMGSKRVQLDFIPTAVIPSPGKMLPQDAHLIQNVPNPFNALTVISYSLTRPCAVTIHIYDATGRLVRTLLKDQHSPAGQHRITWDGRDDWGRRVSSGIYLCRMQAGSTRQSTKMVLLF